jgi:hypothetical protein
MIKICGLVSSKPNDQVPALMEKMYGASLQPFYRNREVVSWE